jgi:hypothetical protein
MGERKLSERPTPRSMRTGGSITSHLSGRRIRPCSKTRYVFPASACLGDFGSDVDVITQVLALERPWVIDEVIFDAKDKSIASFFAV